MTKIMNSQHPMWNEFLDRLEGPEGCNFQGKYDSQGNVIPDSITWHCEGGNNKPKAQAILKTIKDICVADSLNYFEKMRCHCDCEIVFNLADNQ